MASRPLIRAAAAASVMALLTAGAVGATPPRTTFVAPVRIEFPNGDDWEPAIAADALGHVYVLTTHYVGFAGGATGDADPSCPACGSPHMDLQVSSDGGATFSAPRAPFPTSTRQDDPQLVVDPADGRTLWASYMQDNKSSQHVARSDDFGLTWHTALVEPLQRGTDKDVLAVRGSDVYLVYHTMQKVFVSASHDGGQTWTTDNLLNGTTNSQLGQSLPSGGAVAPDGSVYFAWNGVTASGQAKGSINLYVTTSRDAGATWATTVVDVPGSARLRLRGVGLLGRADRARRRRLRPGERAVEREPIEVRDAATLLRHLDGRRPHLLGGPRRLRGTGGRQPRLSGAGQPGVG